MAYSRLEPGCDVFVMAHVHHYLECTRCKLSGNNEKFGSTQDMLSHLQEHMQNGDKVPAYLIEGLNTDWQVNDKWILEKSESRVGMRKGGGR